MLTPSQLPCSSLTLHLGKPEQGPYPCLAPAPSWSSEPSSSVSDNNAYPASPSAPTTPCLHVSFLPLSSPVFSKMPATTSLTLYLMVCPPCSSSPVFCAFLLVLSPISGPSHCLFPLPGKLYLKIARWFMPSFPVILFRYYLLSETCPIYTV